MFWFSKDVHLPWLEVEKLSSKGLALDNYLFSASFKTLNKSSTNPFVKNTIVVWNAVQKLLGDSQGLSCFSPIWGNDRFAPAKNDMGFKVWLNKSIVELKDVYKDYTLMSFNELKAKYDIPQNHFFKYLQLRSFILANSNNSVQQPSLSILETQLF